MIVRQLLQEVRTHHNAFHHITIILRRLLCTINVIVCDTILGCGWIYVCHCRCVYSFFLLLFKCNFGHTERHRRTTHFSRTFQPKHPMIFKCQTLKPFDKKHWRYHNFCLEQHSIQLDFKCQMQRSLCEICHSANATAF